MKGFFMFSKEQIDFLHDTGKMPDWAYYQQNRNSIAENYKEQKAKIYREIRQDTVQKLQETEIEKYIEEDISNIIQKALLGISNNIKLIK